MSRQERAYAIWSRIPAPLRWLLIGAGLLVGGFVAVMLWIVGLVGGANVVGDLLIPTIFTGEAAPWVIGAVWGFVYTGVTVLGFAALGEVL